VLALALAFSSLAMQITIFNVMANCLKPALKSLESILGEKILWVFKGGYSIIQYISELDCGLEK
jgi:hypothetical protein